MKENHIIKNIKDNGYCIINNIFSKKDTLIFKKKINNILIKRIKKNESCGSEFNQCLYNYFYEDLTLLKLIHIPFIDSILKELLDNNYVLQSSNAQNRLLDKYNYLKVKKKFSIGTDWHVDSRFIGGKKIQPGFSYLVIIALDPFLKNSGTQFIKRSHKILRQPKRNANYKYKSLEMEEGSVCIMDTGMWHRGGIPSSNSRWSIFSIYSCWWVKPYYAYYNFLKDKKHLIKKKYRKLLHFNSIPPNSDNERFNTLTKNY
jgi:hypothetical protein